jgi:hypothetical protein
MIEKILDFRGSEHVRDGPPLGALANKFDRIAIEQLVPPCVVKERRYEVSDFGAAVSGQRQSAKPGFHLNRAHVAELEGTSSRDDPSVQIELVIPPRGVATPAVILRQFMVCEVHRGFRDCHRCWFRESIF